MSKRTKYFDPYVYTKTQTLINKLGTQDQKTLTAFELAKTNKQLVKLQTTPLAGGYDFAHLQAFHKHIFQDVYEWAGKPSTVHIFKAELLLAQESINYPEPFLVKPYAMAALNSMKAVQWPALDMDQKAIAFSRSLAELWKVHAFREGNTRTTANFCCQYADSIGMPVDRTLLAKDSKRFRDSLVAYNAEMVGMGDIRKPEYLEEMVRFALVRGLEKESEGKEV